MPGSTVSVSLVGLAVYFSWGLLFLSLIAILFFLACTPCQRSVRQKWKWVGGMVVNTMTEHDKGFKAT